MTTTSLDPLIDAVRGETNGCMDGIALGAIRDSAREFFRKSGVFKYTDDSFAFVADTAEYDLWLPDSSDIARIDYLRQDELPIVAKSHDWLNSRDPYWKTNSGRKVSFFTMMSKRVLRVTPIPTEVPVSSVDLRLILTLAPDATSIDEEMLENWGETILAGALFRVFGMRGQKWSDMEGSKLNESWFYRGVSEAKVVASKDGTPASNTITITALA